MRNSDALVYVASSAWRLQEAGHSRSCCGSVAIIKDSRWELGDFSEDVDPGAPLTDKGLAWSDSPLGPQQVTIAGLGLCNSDDDIHCGLSIVVAGRAPETVAATDDVPVLVDWLQHELRQGPCVAADAGETLVSRDLAADPRWPEFGKTCDAVLNVCSLVSIQIPVTPPDRARLNFYSSEPHAFDHLDLDGALWLSRVAGPMVRRQIEEFGEALLAAGPRGCSRVAVAVGTIIGLYQVNSTDAFDMLVEASRDLRRGLLGVAIDVAADGHLPEAAILRARERRPGEAPGRLPGVRTWRAHGASPGGRP